MFVAQVPHLMLLLIIVVGLIGFGLFAEARMNANTARMRYSERMARYSNATKDMMAETADMIDGGTEI